MSQAMRFKVLSSTHNQWETDKRGEKILYDQYDAEGKPVLDAGGRQVRNLREKTYVAGDTVYSKEDLSKMLVNKFERLPDLPQYQENVPIPETATPIAGRDLAELERMGLKQLLSFAADNGIDLQGKTRREEILTLIRASA